MDSGLVKIYQSPKTVLTTADIAVLWNETKASNLYAKIHYYVKRHSLLRLRRGIFAKNKNFNPKELATKIFTPAYVSFETALREAGIIFQHYESIFVASYTTTSVKVGNVSIGIRKIKDEVLYNAAGVVMKNNFSQATSERAFLDMIYLYPRYYFDNLDDLNWDTCQELVKIYDNKQLRKRLALYQKKYAE